jgi:hypothetical protein
MSDFRVVKQSQSEPGGIRFPNFRGEGRGGIGHELRVFTERTHV